ncbi:hypothetical protein PENTCL1PPCAC_23441, partial [Pristionchus entomophagus]
KDLMETDGGPDTIEVPQLPAVAPRSAQQLLHSRPMPAALVARLDRPGQQTASAAGGVSVGFKQRSGAARSALEKAVVDAQPEDKKRRMNEPQKKNGEEEVAATAAVVPAAGSEARGVQPIEKEDCSKQPTARERLLERIRKKTTEKEGGMEKAKRLRKILIPLDRFTMFCETRAAGTTLVTSGEEATLAVWTEMLPELSGKELAEKKMWLKNSIDEINLQEDPEVKETMRRKMCREIATYRLERTMENKLDDESTWQ